MKPIELKVTRIGNSRGVRIPAPKLSWEETAREMAGSGEDWTAWDATTADGLENVPWSTPAVRRVAESARTHDAKRRRKG